ncbi:MAG: DUF6265 family protein [Candidatus Hodarchaeota archaeon]
MNKLQSISKVLYGNWQGKIGDDLIDEYWSIHQANSMMGMFRWIKDGKISLYELMVIDNVGDKIVLKIKHFNSDLTGWEEKMDFVHYVLVDVTDSEIIFGSDDPNEKGRLIYKKLSENKLISILEMSKSDQILKFEFNRM